MTEAALYRLLAWLSPAYPVGAFSYSHGLETAVERGAVDSAKTLRGWLEVFVKAGSLRAELLLFRRAWDAAAAQDQNSWLAINTEALARRSTAETALESRQQGRAFLQTTRKAWPNNGLDRLFPLLQPLKPPNPIAYVTAVAAACAPSIPLPTALLAYAHAVAANLVSAGVRLVPLGQTDGQHVLAALEASVTEAVERVLSLSPQSEPATAAPMLELQSMQHETQYTRLFRS